MSLSPVYAYNLLDKTDFAGQVRFESNFVDNKQVEAQVFGVTGFLEIKSQLLESLSADIKVGFTTEVGSSNAFNNIDEYAPRRQWRMKRAFLKWDPLDFFTTRVGAINQRDYDAPLLITGTAFMGVQEELSFQITKDYRFWIRLQQAIPNNLNLTQRIGVVEDGTPTFLMETIGLELGGDLLAFKAQGGRWSYDSLSTGTAYQSQFLGNSIRGGSRLISSFIYRYSGYTASGTLRMHFSDNFGLKFSGQFLYNEEAPEERNMGQFLKTSLILGHFQPSFLFFRNESDSSPGFYNSAFFSHNNHEGYAVELRYCDPYDNDENKITAFINYVDSRTLKFSSFQSDTKKVNFSISLPYDL